MSRRKLTPEEVAAGYTIDRIAGRTAYARNGNTQNPTVEYRYDVKLHGKLVGSEYKLGKAISLVEDHKADPR
jgi:hypothetical protein